MRTLNESDIHISPDDRPGAFSASAPRRRTAAPKVSKSKARKPKRLYDRRLENLERVRLAYLKRVQREKKR